MNANISFNYQKIKPTLQSHLPLTPFHQTNASIDPSMSESASKISQLHAQNFLFQNISLQ